MISFRISQESQLASQDLSGMQSTLRHLEILKSDLEAEKEKTTKLQDERTELEGQLGAMTVQNEGHRQKVDLLTQRLQVHHSRDAYYNMSHALELANGLHFFDPGFHRWPKPLLRT